MRMTSFATLPLAIACAALLAACGGGGGSGGDNSSQASANSDINASNYQDFSGALARTVLDLGGSASVSEVFGPAGGAQAASVVRRALGVTTGGGRASIQSAGRLAVSQETDVCDYAGTLTVSINDANNNGILDVGDSLSFTAANCQFAATDQPMNGSFTTSLQQVQVDSQNNLHSLQASGSFTNLSIGSDAMNGAFQFSLTLPSAGGETLQMSFSNFTATHAGQSVTYNATLAASYAADGSGSFSLNGTVKPGSDVYLLEQVQNFATTPASDYPTSGTLRLKDAAGDTLVLEAKSGNLVDFKFYPAGSTAPSQQWLAQPWSSFGS